MSFLHLYARSLWQTIKQSIRQWVNPDNRSPVLNAALDLSRSKSKLIDVLRTPYRAPRANAYCERFIGSLRRECLDHVIILNERHLHRIVKEYATYFNTDRPHQGIDQCIPGQSKRPEALESPPGNEKLVSRPVLNGLHHTYSWATTQSVGHSQAQRSIVH